MLLQPFWVLLICSEAHPDAIGSDGVATEEAYHNDLAYLKRKVLLLFYNNSSFNPSIHLCNVGIPTEHALKMSLICLLKHTPFAIAVKDIQ